LPTIGTQTGADGAQQQLALDFSGRERQTYYLSATLSDTVGCEATSRGGFVSDINGDSNAPAMQLIELWSLQP